MNSNKRSRRLFEKLDPSVDVSDVNYVFSLFTRILKSYIDRFGSTSQSKRELYNEYNDNILPGGLDFCLQARHCFGSQETPDLGGFLAVKKGCWLNSLDFMNKYDKGFDDYSLAHGIMISSDDLEDAERYLKESVVKSYGKKVSYLIQHWVRMVNTTISLKE